MSQKGSKFERDMAKEFSLWFSKGKADDWIYRTAGSGARATSRAKKNLTTANSIGDLGYLHKKAAPLFDVINFELKSGYSSRGRITKEELSKAVCQKSEDDRLKEVQKIINRAKRGVSIGVLEYIDSAPTKKTRLLLDWYFKLKAQSEGRIPFVVFKRDSKVACGLLCYKDYWKLFLNNTVRLPDIDIIRFDHKNEEYVVFRMTDFFRIVKPEYIHFLVGKYVKDRKQNHKLRRRLFFREDYNIEQKL